MRGANNNTTEGGGKKRNERWGFLFIWGITVDT